MISDSPDLPSSAPGPKSPAGAVARAVAAAPAPGLVLVSIVSIQLGAAVAVNLFPALGPVGTALLRLAFSAVLLLIAARRSLAWASAREHAPALLLYGAILGGMNLSFYGAIERIPLGIAVAIEFIGPLGLAAVTSRRVLDFAWIGLAVLGIVLLTPEIGAGLDPVGVVLAGVAGLCWAGFALMSQRIGRALPGHSGLAIGMAVAALVVLPVELVAGRIGDLDAGILVATLAVAILSTAVPWSLEFEALRRMAAKTYGVLVTLEPAVAATVGAMLLGQAMGPAALLAIACITAAGVGVTLGDRRDSRARALAIAHEPISGGPDTQPE